MSTIINASTSSGLIQTADTSGTLELQSNGTTKFTVSSAGSYGQITSSSAVTYAGQTAIDFTSIPSWVKRITVMFDQVSTSGTSVPLVRIGSAGTPATSGYASASTNTGAFTGNATSTVGFNINSVLAANTITGQMVLTQISSNKWVSTHVISFGSGQAAATNGGGVVTLGGALDILRITTVNGTDTFDAGSINILYEG